MDVFCGWGRKGYLGNDNKINGVDIGAECIKHMTSGGAPSTGFNNSKTIAENIESGVPHADIDADRFDRPDVHYFGGIKAADLVKLPGKVIKKIGANEFTEIVETTLTAAFKEANPNRLLDDLDYTKIPDIFYKKFTFDVLDTIKDKIPKSKWASTTVDNHKNGDNWISATELKAALEDKTFTNFLKLY